MQLRNVCALALVSSTRAYYQLKWIGDYQTGAWDTDAAENVAYEPVTKKAFVASAEAGSVQVVSLDDPVNMQLVGTLQAGVTAKGNCRSVDCTYEDFDFGGGSAPCGYAPMVNIVFDRGDCSACNKAAYDAWMTSGASGDAPRCSSSNCVYSSNPRYNRNNGGDLEVNALAATPEGCKQLCQQNQFCEFFSWENEWWTSGDTSMYLTGTSGLTDGAHRAGRCFMKAQYGNAIRESQGANTSPDCSSFVHWEGHKMQSKRGTYCNGVTTAQCETLAGGSVSSGSCMFNGARGEDLACVALGGTVTSTDWATGSGPRYPYGFQPGNHYSHVYDKFWEGASGPATCPMFDSDSVQSVAVATMAGYADPIVAVAMPHKFDFANGMLAFFNAKTEAFIGCQEAGIKPEGIASANGKISCINEGSAMDRQETTMDTDGSMTMCTGSGTGSGFSISCSTYPLEEANFAAGAWKHSAEFRNDNVRLYGPNGNNVTYDLEPEGGAFTEDGKYLLVVMQDNDAYAMWDVAAGKYLFMKGFGYEAIKADTSDKDDKIAIKNTWAGATAKKIRMPDQVTSFTSGGKYYFITANEGGSRDGGDGLLGESGDFEGEEVRMKDVSCTSSAACADAELGRVLTTSFMPSDYAINACGNNLCDAFALNAGMDTASSGYMPGVKGAGAHKCIYIDADYGGCGSVCNLHADHDMWHDPSGCSNYPTTLGHYVHSDADNEYLGVNCTAANCDTRGWRFAGWAQTSGVDASLAEAADSPSPLGYDSAVACQAICDADPACMYWYAEFEMGKYECYTKAPMTATGCHEFSYKDDHYEYSTRFQDGTPGVKPYVSQGTASWGGPRSSNCAANKYSNAALSEVAGPGVPGGSFTIGGRSFSIFRWAPGETALTQVFDSAETMEVKQSLVAGGLCTGCETGPNNAAGNACDDYCPFNSDEAPPKLDDRSDAKGPEPECVTTGLLQDGTTRLAFVGMERTGGIITYDITNPEAPLFQDYLNVRNWMGSAADIAAHSAADSAGTEDAFLVEKALNDGPESFAFIPASVSPANGKDMLLAVTPLAGRLTAYEIEESTELRADDGSCATTAGCPYLTVAAGGSGLSISTLKGGLSTYDPNAVASSSTTKMPEWVLPVIIAVGVVVLLVCICLGIMCRAERRGKPIFTPLDAPPAAKKASA
jgi:hypothetical protein